MRTRRSIPTLLVAVLLAVAGSVRADVGLDDLAARFAAEAGTSSELVAGTRIEDPRPRRLLASLRGSDGTAHPCATPLTLAVLRARDGWPMALREDAARRLTPPPLVGAEAWTSPDGFFVLRYTTVSSSPDAVDGTDLDGDDVPDAVALAGRAAVRAREVLVERLGWPEPTGEEPFEIVLARLPGPDAWLLPLGSASSGRTGSLMILDPDILDDEPAVVDAIAHQIAHAAQWRSSLEAEAWWYEASAAWAGLQASGDLSRLLPWLRARAERPETSLLAEGPAASLGAAWFALYLEEQAGAAAVGATWSRLGAEPGLTVAAVLDDILRTADGHGLADHVRAHQLWNLATGPRDSGRHYRNGSLLPLPEADPFVTRIPESGAERLRAPRGLAANVLGFSTEGLDGGLRLGFEGEEGIAWAVDAVGLRADGSLERVPMELDARETGEVVLPASRYASVLLVVHNLEPEAERTGSYAWRAEHEPGYPYEMQGLRAEPARGRVLLTWTTSSEKELYGWRVLVAESPDGPWRPASPVLLPAIGLYGGSQDYSWLDTDALGGQRRWYRVEGVTIHGVPVTAGTVSAEAQPVLTRPALLQRLR